MKLQKNIFHNRQINMSITTKLLLSFITFKIIVCSDYNGIMFPSVYLKTEKEISTEDDLVNYLDRLRRIMNFIVLQINYTDVNEMFGSYYCSCKSKYVMFSRGYDFLNLFSYWQAIQNLMMINSGKQFYVAAILKRTLQDYGSKLQKYSHKIKKIAEDGDDIVSHLNYFIKYGSYITSRRSYFNTSQPLADTTGLVYSMGRFRRNSIEKFINEDELLTLNDFIQGMDELNLSKEKYAELSVVAHFNNDYGINIHRSDECLNALVENMDPYDYSVMHPCKYSARCWKGVFQTPSVAYSLSHRMMLQFMYFTNRRCYLRSPELDMEHLDKLCAAMYREAVYIARRGYFFRDLFMEHIGLCGMMGYEEFHRRKWFRKTASWVDDDGCIEENVNIMVNRSRVHMNSAIDEEERAEVLADLYLNIDTKCHRHQQAVALMVLANAIRHTAHYL